MSEGADGAGTPGKWWEGFGMHAIADAVNAGLVGGANHTTDGDETGDLVSEIVGRFFNDPLQVRPGS